MAALPTRETLERCRALEADYQAASRRARSYQKELSELKDQILLALKTAGRDTVKRGPLRATLVERPGTVAWMKEFIAVAGNDRATELRAAAEAKPSVVISEDKADSATAA